MSPVTYEPEGSSVSHKSPRHRFIGPGRFHPREETASPRRDHPGGSPPPNRGSPRRDLPGGSRPPNRSSPRHRPPGGSSQQGPSVPITPPVRAGQVILTPTRARQAILTPVRATQAIGVVHQALPG